MEKIFRLEAYHWDKDYWSTIGSYSSQDVAEKNKRIIENSNKSVSCNIFEEELNAALLNIAKK